jgi:uncharacterized protein (DUF2249 family)/iron-sulfur cluster repair protein YtfE (RIC family)
MSQTDADHAAADAVVAHHTELAAALTRHVTLLRAAARQGSDPQWREHRANLLTWLRTELIPHATAEEEALYPAAAAQPAGAALIDGMLTEHRAIAKLVTELEVAGTPVDAAGAARALAALFEVHLDKENELVLPLLLSSEQASLAGILRGMHDLLGGQAGHEHGDGGCGCGGQGGGGGCGGQGGGQAGGCGCGGESGEAAPAEAPLLSVDTRLDVRTVPHAQRHATVLAAVSGLPADGALVLVAPHAPLPLLAEIERRFPGQIDREWLQEGPDVWQIRLHREFVESAVHGAMR